MNNISMMLRVFAIIAAVAATTLFFLGKGKLEEKQTQLNATQATLRSTEGELATAQQDIARLDNRLKAESEALAKSKQELEGVRSEVYTARQEVSRTQQQLGQARNQITQLEEAANKLRADLVEAEQMVATSRSQQGETSTLQARVRELEAANANLQTQVEEARSNAQLFAGRTPAAGVPGAAATPGAAGALPAFAGVSQETQIESIRANDGLIVLRALPELNLAAGQTLKLSSNMKPVGSVEIFEVSDSLALAHILPGSNARGLKQGDQVSLYR
jgi:hypothetical protein